LPKLSLGDCVVTPFNDYQFRLKDCVLGAQTLFIAFGALVLMPILVGLNPSIALLTAGVGTLIFQLVTRGQVPVFLGSSFAFVPATIYGIQQWGLPATLCGLSVSSVMYFVISALIKWRGQNLVNRIFPHIVTAPIITSIGLYLAPVAVNMAMGRSGNGSEQLFPEHIALSIATVAFASAVFTRMFAKGKMQLVPILVGVIVGYILSAVLGLVNFDAVTNAKWFSIPTFVTPEWHWQAIVMILPIAAVSAIEHIGGIAAIGSVTGRDYFKYPGVHRTLIGDGLSSGLAAFMGGPPNITYAEVTAGVALTRVFNPAVMTWAALAAISLAFVGKVGAFLQTIPTPVMGGISILLFGAISVTGLHLLMLAKEDLMKPRSMTIVGLILIIPVGKMTLNIGDLPFGDIGLAGIVGVVLNLILPMPKPNQPTQPKVVEAPSI
jgi:uracil permease